MQSVSILKSASMVLGMLLILFFFNPNKIIAQAYVNGNLSTGGMNSTDDLAPAGYLWSEVQAGNTVAGYDGNISSNRTVADDFTIPSGTWNITKFTCYAFAEGYPGWNSPLNDIRIRIYDTDPSVGNPTPIFGDLITNRYSSTYTIHTYRVLNGAHDLGRQIWKIEADISTSLTAGTYWIEWQIGSTLPNTFIPASTVAGTATQPGNNAKTNLLPNSWSNITDGSNQQDLPFRIDYNTGPCSGTPAPGNTLTTLANPCVGVEFELSVQNPPEGSGINYQWQYSYDGIAYTDVFTGTNPVFPFGTNVNTYYRAKVGCGTNEAFSNPILIVPNPQANCYCTPHIADCSGDNMITNVSIGTLNNTSGCAVNGYTNYGLDAGMTIPVLAPGAVVPISVTLTSSAADKSVAVWFDFNHTGTFDYTGYLGTSTGGVISGSVSVPPNAPLGSVKMRVRAVSGNVFPIDACGTYLSSETEDYVVDINTSSSPCSGVPAPGNTLTSANAVCQLETFTLSLQNPGSGTGLSYQWLYSMDNITYNILSGATGSICANAITLTYSTYFKAIVTCGGDTASSTPVLIHLKDPAECYCIPPASDCSGGNEITNVTIGTLNNSSGCSSGGYIDYSTNGSIEIPFVAPGTSIPITVSGGTPGDKAGVWIDFNYDGYLSADEYTFIGTVTGSPITNSITVPNYSYPQGSVPARMRVRIESSQPMDGNSACANYSNSETEDYTVTLGTCTSNITIQPVGAMLCEGNDHTFTVGVTGSGLSYQWQQSTNGCGGTFTDIPGATSADYTLTNFSASQNLYAYSCRVTSSCGTVVSNCALVQLSAPAIFPLGPQDVTACDGGTVVFTGYAWPTPQGYQWQVSTDGGASFNDIAGATNDTLYINPVTVAYNGNLYQLLAYGCAATPPIVSNTATLTISGSPIITQQPASVTTCAGSWASFYIAAGGLGYTYQWQISTDGGATFSNIPGATGDSIYISPVTAAYNGNQYQVVVSGPGCTAFTISTTATLTVASPVITLQPLPVTVCEHDIAYFNAAAIGNTLNYQWQVSTDGGATFNDIPYAAQYSLMFNTYSNMNGYQYRLKVTGCSVNVFSNAATLTVNAQPVTGITANPPVTTLAQGESTVLTASVSPAGTYNYTWRLDYVDIPGANSDTYTVNYGSPGNYSVVVSGIPANCPDTSNTITVTDTADGGRFPVGQLSVYSNPNNGIFTVVYPNLPAQSSLSVIDGHGTRIMSKLNLVPNQPVHIDIHAAPSGIYTVALFDAAREKIVTTRIVIIH